MPSHSLEFIVVGTRAYITATNKDGRHEVISLRKVTPATLRIAILRSGENMWKS